VGLVEEAGGGEGFPLGEELGELGVVHVEVRPLHCRLDLVRRRQRNHAHEVVLSLGSPDKPEVLPLTKISIIYYNASAPAINLLSKLLEDLVIDFLE
jgi:hypothetical protein